MDVLACIDVLVDLKMNEAVDSPLENTIACKMTGIEDADEDEIEMEESIE